MRTPVYFKYALRSLRRHFRRTIISVLGIGLGCGVCLFTVGFVRGEKDMFMRAAAESGTGHLKIVPEEWPDTRDIKLRLKEWEDILQTARNTEGVEVATPSAAANCLLAFGTRVAGVQMAGVDPPTEQKASRLVRNIDSGRYLSTSDEAATVVGGSIADRLKVETGDQLVATLSDKNGQIQSELLEIVGIVRTGSSMIDSTICQVPLNELKKLTRRDGASEITILLKDQDRLEDVRQKLEKTIPKHAVVMTWDEVRPELRAGVRVDENFTNLTVGIIVLVVFLGIASAQLTAVLERRKEFAVLAAVGMKGPQMAGIMLMEGIALGVMGALTGLVLASPFSYLVAEKGIDIGALIGTSELEMSNILLDPVFYGDFGWWLIPLALVLALTATVLGSIYPAWYAVKTDPASALRVEQ